MIIGDSKSESVWILEVKARQLRECELEWKDKESSFMKDWVSHWKNNFLGLTAPWPRKRKSLLGSRWEWGNFPEFRSQTALKDAYYYSRLAGRRFLRENSEMVSELWDNSIDILDLESLTNYRQIYESYVKHIVWSAVEAGVCDQNLAFRWRDAEFLNDPRVQQYYNGWVAELRVAGISGQTCSCCGLMLRSGEKAFERVDDIPHYSMAHLGPANTSLDVQFYCSTTCALKAHSSVDEDGETFDFFKDIKEDMLTPDLLRTILKENGVEGSLKCSAYECEVELQEGQMVWTDSYSYYCTLECAILHWNFYSIII